MLRGTITALVTPFQKSGAIDEDALRRLVDFQIEKGQALPKAIIISASKTGNDIIYCPYFLTGFSAFFGQ